MPPSRVSSKSSLSPSTTKGSSRFDLGKDSDVDMGRKSRPSATSGGIGVTQEVANIAGVSVVGGVSVDISPIGLNISGNVDYEDPSKNSISIAGGAEIPGGILGVSGGVTINTSSGEVEEVAIGGEALGIGVNVSVGDNGAGVSLSVQIPFTPIEISLGLGFPPREKPKEPVKPPPQESIEKENKGFGSDSSTWSFLKPNCYYEMLIVLLAGEHLHKNCLGYGSGDGSFGYSFEEVEQLRSYSYIMTGITYDEYYRVYQPVVKGKTVLGSVFSRQRSWIYVVEGDLLIGQSQSPNGGEGVAIGTTLRGLGGYAVTRAYGMGNRNWAAAFQERLDFYNNGRQDYTSYYFIPLESCPGGVPSTPIFRDVVSLPPSTSPSPAPFPNPPPRKENMDECCRDSVRLLRRIHKHLGVSPIPGMEPLEQFAGVKAKGETFQGDKMAFPFEVPKVWLDPTAKPDQVLLVRNLSELMLVMGSQSERLEHVLGTKEFLKDREGQLRGSEVGTIKWLTQRVTGISGNDFTYPDPNDFWFNTDDGIINEKKVEVKSFADAIRYLVESQNRLERILPVAEIKNSTIPARWVYPGKKGQLRVGNLIHLVEYMFRADDRARGFWPQTVKIKDANPAIKGDQKIELKFESQADMLREILKFLIDTEGDGDISNNFALRSAIQQCQQHQLLVQIHAMTDAMVEYMDFKIDRTTTKVPMPFSPFAGHQPNLFDNLLTKLGFGNKQIPGSIDKNTEEAVEALFEGVLQNTEVEVAIIKANEKKSMSEAFMEILKHASAASAAVSERVGEGALKRLVDSAGIAQAVSRFLLKRDIAESNGVGDLDQWINSAEAGYTDKPESESLRFPESNPLEPYDRPTAENPRIREIDTKDPKAD